MSSSNRIGILFDGRYDEAPAAAALKPGHLIKKNSAGAVLKNSTAGRRGVPMFAFADEMQGVAGACPLGRELMDAYAADDIVPFGIFKTGDVANARLPAAAAAVVIGDALTSNGDGTLIKATQANSTLYAATAASTALNTHTTITAFDVSYTIPAGLLAVGDILNVKATVLFANASNSTETVLITLKLGSVTIVATAAVDNAAGDIATIDATIHVRAIGASGSILAMGFQSLGVPGTATQRGFYTAPTAIDTTGTLAVTVNQTCSASHANTGGQLTELVVTRSLATAQEVVGYADEAIDNSAGSDEAFVACRIA